MAKTTKKVAAVKAPKTKAPAKAAAKKSAPKAPKAAVKAKPAAKKAAAVKAPKTKTQILAAIAEAAGITKAQSKDAYEAFLAIAYKGAKDAKGILLPGLGKLIKDKRKARMGRNPATGESIKIPAKTVAKFRLAKACKDAVLAK